MKSHRRGTVELVLDVLSGEQSLPEKHLLNLHESDPIARLEAAQSVGKKDFNFKGLFDSGELDRLKKVTVRLMRTVNCKVR